MIVSEPLHTAFSFPKTGPWILLVLWFLVQSSVFLHYGIVTAVDSDFYLGNAQLFLQGEFPADRGIWYSSYSLFLALVMGCGGNLTTVVFLQFLFTGIAAVALYQVVNRLFSDHRTAFLSVLFYILWVKIHQWNSYIYTESLFISFSIISFALLSLSKGKIHCLLTALVTIFTLFLRPTGICLFLAVCAFLLFKTVHKKKVSRPKLLLTVAGASALSWLLLNAMLEEYVFYFIDSYSKAELIYPNVTLGFQPPKQLDLPSRSHAPLLQLIEFALYNPLYFIKLSFLKLFLFIGNIKPYFSWAHNLMVILVLYPLYALAIYGCIKMHRVAEKFFMSTFIFMQTLTISLTSENWDGRFLILILPFVFIFSASGIGELLKKKNSTRVEV